MKKTLRLVFLATLATLTTPSLATSAEYLSPLEISDQIENGATESGRQISDRYIAPLDEVISKEDQLRLDTKRAKRGIQAQSTFGEFDGVQPSVDLRQFDTSVKSQFGSTCTSFGLVAAMENFLGRTTPVELSERHLWSLYKQYSSKVAMSRALKNAITFEDKWPQSRTNPLPGYKDGAVHKLKSSTFLDDSIPAAVRALDKGLPVYVGMRVPAGMKSCNKVIGPNTKATKGGHAIAIVGYQLDPAVKSGGYFIIKNSWGADCGDNGYQYLDFNNCKRNDMYCQFWSINQVVDTRLAQ
jgi:hypothetical protein